MNSSHLLTTLHTTCSLLHEAYGSLKCTIFPAPLDFAAQKFTQLPLQPFFADS